MLAAPLPPQPAASRWPAIWENTMKSFPDANQWTYANHGRKIEGWTTVLRTVNKTKNIGVKIVQWEQEVFVRDAITWVEGDEPQELVICVRPTKAAYQTARQLIREWIAVAPV